VRLALARRAVTDERRRARDDRRIARRDALRRVAVGPAHLLVAADVGAVHAEAHVGDAEVLDADLAERARELARDARRRALALHALRVRRADRALVDHRVAVVIVAVAALLPHRRADADHRAVQALLQAVADLPDPARARRDVVLVDHQVAVVVDAVARVV